MSNTITPRRKAKSSTFSGKFWRTTINYMEMAKLRLYEGGPTSEGARYALYHALLTALKLLAPILPFVTERIYQGMFATSKNETSIQNLSLGTELARLRLHTEDAELAAQLENAITDLTSITRAMEIVLESGDEGKGNGRWQLHIEAVDS